MPSIDRRSSGQSESGPTRAQFHLALSGVVLCCAAAAFAVFVQAFIGLFIIEACAFCIGFYCSSPKTLDSTNRRMDTFLVHLSFVTLVQLLLLTTVVQIALNSNVNLAVVYKHFVFLSSVVTFVSAWTLGLVQRAPWQVFRV